MMQSFFGRKDSGIYGIEGRILTGVRKIIGNMLRIFQRSQRGENRLNAVLGSNISMLIRSNGDQKGMSV